MNKDSWLLLLRGLAMGAADVVPGVSGGTIALITGIYERLVGALSRIDVRRLSSTIDWRLFVPLGAGILASIFLFSNVVHAALTDYPGQTYAFFFGLIVVSAWLVWQKLGARSWYSAAAILAGAGLSYLFVGLDPLQGNHSLLTVFLSAMVAIMAMLLPGVSGSFLLLLLGQYAFILQAVRGLDWLVLAVFILGAGTGMLIFARALKHLMEHHRVLTLSFLVGMMLGSLRLPYREIMQAEVSWGAAVIPAAIGVIGVWVIEKIAAAKTDRAQRPGQFDH